jgi:hypothetical protein
MLNKNPATKDKKKNTAMYIVGYTTYVLSSNWRGNDQPIELKGGKIN